MQDESGINIFKAMLLMERRKYQEAEKIFSGLIKSEPKRDDFYLLRGRCYESQGEFDEALNDYSRAIELAPQAILGYLDRSNYYRSRGQPDNAHRDADKIIQIKPRDFMGYFQKGLIYLDEHNYSQSFKNFKQALGCRFDGWLSGKKLKDLTRFYYEWSLGLSDYYLEDNADRATKHFIRSLDILNNLPEYIMEKDVSYVANSIIAYFMILPRDATLRSILSEPSRIPEKTPALEGLAKEFSQLLESTVSGHKETRALLSAKRDICRVLLPPDSPQGVKPEDSAKLMKQIDDTLASLKYKNRSELVRILAENRRRLESAQPFTKELAKAAAMADGAITAATSTSVMIGMIKIPYKSAETYKYDPDGRLIGKDVTMYYKHTKPGESRESAAKVSPKPIQASLIEVPPGTKWHEVKIRMAPDYCLITCKNNRPQRFHYVQLDFLDKRTGHKPDDLWEMLLVFARDRGQLRYHKPLPPKQQLSADSPDNLDYGDYADKETRTFSIKRQALSQKEIDAFKAKIKRLRDKLQSLFPGITGDPLPYTDTDSYKSAFQIGLRSDEENPIRGEISPD